jgi:hypothetical protein
MVSFLPGALEKPGKNQEKKAKLLRVEVRVNVKTYGKLFSEGVLSCHLKSPPLLRESCQFLYFF